MLVKGATGSLCNTGESFGNASKYCNILFSRKLRLKKKLAVGKGGAVPVTAPPHTRNSAPHLPPHTRNSAPHLPPPPPPPTHTHAHNTFRTSPLNNSMCVASVGTHVFWHDFTHYKTS